MENEFERGFSKEHAHCFYVFTSLYTFFQATESIATLCSFVRSPCDCRRVLMSREEKKSRNALNAERTIISLKTKTMRTLWLLFDYFNTVKCWANDFNIFFSKDFEQIEGNSYYVISNSLLQAIKIWKNLEKKNIQTLNFYFNCWLYFRYTNIWLRR